MELDADEPGVIDKLDGLGQLTVRRQAGEDQADRFEPFPVVDVDLVAVAVAFADARTLTVDRRDAGAVLEITVIGAEAHGSALVVIDLAGLHDVAAGPLGQQPDHRMGAGAELGR